MCPPAAGLVIHTTMYYDDEGVLNAPVDKVWELLAAHTDANVPRIHAALRSVRTVSEDENVTVREVEREGADGEVETMRMRFTAHPPHCLTIEYLDGSLAESWFTSTYIPEGERTRVVCAGHFHAKDVDDATILRIMTDFLDNAFEEDAHFLEETILEAAPEREEVAP